MSLIVGDLRVFRHDGISWFRHRKPAKRKNSQQHRARGGGFLLDAAWNDAKTLRPLLRFRTLPVLFNNVLERPEEVFLEAEVGQLSFLQELHGELPQGIHSKDRHIFIGIAAHLQQKATTL